MEPSTYPKQPNPPPPSEPQPSKAEGVPPPYSAPGVGFAGSQQVPQQQYGGQYNQGYQPGPSPVMYAGQQVGFFACILSTTFCSRVIFRNICTKCAQIM